MPARKANKDGKPSITIIRREEVIAGGHHGGAWKVAYADFVTAMMAFFLLMWLLNATTEAQRRGLADYFSPSLSSVNGHSGTGRPLGGTSPFTDGPAVSDKGAMRVMNATAPPVDVEDDGSDTEAQPRPHQLAGGALPDGGAGAGEAAAPRPAAPSNAAAAAAIRQSLARDPALARLGSHIDVDITQEGLRVQIKDTAREAMFLPGRAEPTPQASLLLRRLAPLLGALNRPISITGHTDVTKAAGTSNWDLSAARALAARRVLAGAGLADGAVRDVQGRADRDLLLPAQPDAPANRRIAIVVLRQGP